MFAEIKQYLIDLKEEIGAIKVNQTEGRVIFDIKQQLTELKEEISAMHKVNQTGERVFGGGRCFKVNVNQSLADFSGRAYQLYAKFIINVDRKFYEAL